MNSSNIPLDFRSLTRDELEAWFTEKGLPPYRGRQIFQALWRPSFKDFSQVTDFPMSLRKELKSSVTFTDIDIRSVHHSKDGTAKLVLALCDGLFIETVIIPERDHKTICLSTQVGCNMGCKFCYTAKMGFKRDLSPGEIASQVISAINGLALEEKPRNIVFMGMGEPLKNYSNLKKAIQILTDDLALNYSPKRITVSTCGILPEMLELGDDFDVGLAVSIHAYNDETRNKLMPINRKHSINQLIKACKLYHLSKRRRITFEYLLLAGINDDVDHAKGLAGLLKGIPAKVNLIPWNQNPDMPFKAPEEKKVQAFRKILIDLNYTAIIRKSKGNDISAACGQLFQSIKPS